MYARWGYIPTLFDYNAISRTTLPQRELVSNDGGDDNDAGGAAAALSVRLSVSLRSLTRLLTHSGHHRRQCAAGQLVFECLWRFLISGNYHYCICMLMVMMMMMMMMALMMLVMAASSGGLILSHTLSFLFYFLFLLLFCRSFVAAPLTAHRTECARRVCVYVSRRSLASIVRVKTR